MVRVPVLKMNRHAVSTMVATIILIAITLLGAGVVYAIYLSATGPHTKNLQVQTTAVTLTHLTDETVVASLNVKNTGSITVTVCFVTFHGDDDTTITLNTTDLSPGNMKSINEQANLKTTIGSTYLFQIDLEGADGGTASSTSSVVCTGSGGPTEKKHISFLTVGIDETTDSVVLYVDGQNYTMANLPVTSEWVVSSMHTYCFVSDVPCQNPNILFCFDGPADGPASPITVVADASVVGYYKTNYSLTVDVSPTAAGSVSPTEGVHWIEASTMVHATAENTTEAPFNCWKRDGQYLSLATTVEFIMDAPHNLTAVFYQIAHIVVQTNGVDGNATGTIVTVDGKEYAFADLPKNFTWIVGTIHSYQFTQIVESNSPGKRFYLTGVNPPGGQLNVSVNTTIVGSYVIQWLTTFRTSGLDLTAQGTVIVIEGAAYTFNQLPAPFWVNNGAQITYNFTAVIPSSNPSIEFALANVTITVSGSTTITGNYVARSKTTLVETGFFADQVNIFGEGFPIRKRRSYD